MKKEDIFDEWNTYAQKKVLKGRKDYLSDIESTSKLKIVAVTGIRRSGKSSLMMLLLQKLMNDKKKAAYINLEDARIKGESDVLDSVLKWFGDTGYLLLDEITSINGWDGWLARNHELLKSRLHLIVSSSRRTLVAPIKPLRGRMLSFELYPLSFREFLEFRDIHPEPTTAGIGVIERALYEYLVYGGFPEAVLLSEKTEKTRLLGSYFKDILGLDVAEMAGENISTVELFGKYAIETTYFSASKTLNFFKGLGHKIGKQSILNLEKYAGDGYLLFFVPIFSHTIKDRLQYPRKAYAGDTGFINAISGKKDMGRLFENTVFLELKRRKSLTEEIHYWKNKEGHEVDFIVREGLNTKEAIQVAYNLSENTKKRELRGLLACAKEMGIKKGKILTKDFECTESTGNLRVDFLPLRKWLLEEEKL